MKDNFQNINNLRHKVCLKLLSQTNISENVASIIWVRIEKESFTNQVSDARKIARYCQSQSLLF